MTPKQLHHISALPDRNAPPTGTLRPNGGLAAFFRAPMSRLTYIKTGLHKQAILLFAQTLV